MGLPGLTTVVVRLLPDRRQSKIGIRYIIIDCGIRPGVGD
jgi:hypothetical protein